MGREASGQFGWKGHKLGKGKERKGGEGAGRRRQIFKEHCTAGFGSSGGGGGGQGRVIVSLAAARVKSRKHTVWK